MEADDCSLLIVSEGSEVDVGAEVVQPTDAAAPATSVQAGELGDVPPAAVAITMDIVHEQPVLLRRPRALLQGGLAVAGQRRRRPPHFWRKREKEQMSNEARGA